MRRKLSSVKKDLEAYPDISFIENMTIEDLQAEMIEDYCEKYEELTGKSVELGLADPARLILYAASLQIYQGMRFIDAAGKKSFLKYSYGDFLENLGALKGISRNEGTPAQAVVRFSLSAVQESNIYIAAGTRVTSGDEVYFSTVDDTEIPAGDLYIDVNVECTDSGVKGNGYGVGILNILVDQIAYVESVANICETDGGADEESDEQLADRIYLAPSGYSVAGSNESYIYWVKTCNPDISDVKVTSPEPGIVEIRFIMNDGSIPSEVVIDEVAKYLSDKEIRPLTDKVEVMAPEQCKVNIDITYYIAESEKNQVAAIQSNVTNAIQAYKIWQTEKIGRDINPDYLMRLVMNAGAKRVEINSPVYSELSDDSIACIVTESITYGGVESD